jgi:hypothetical protein
MPLTGVLENTAASFARSMSMFDFVMMAIAFAFFALSIAYVYSCNQL